MPNLTTEQKMAVNHECGNILISASAGSGKTHTMIERIKRLMLQKNVSVNEILCVTFTEKAAFEMKEKLKNPYFWLSVFALIFSAAGVDFQQLTSWSLLGEALYGILQNPVAIIAIITAFLGIWNDNSTKGLDRLTFKSKE